jgi:putative MFS transporter
LLASASAAVLLQRLGWRGVAMLGFVPILIGAAVWLLVPESVRWLTAKGRFAEARAGAAKHLGMALDSVPLPVTRPASLPRASLAELYSTPRLFWQTILVWGGSTTAAFGYLLWGPTIVPLALDKPVRRPRNTLSMSPPARSSGGCLWH